MSNVRRPLAPGSVISYADMLGTVVRDDGRTMVVDSEGERVTWTWTCYGETCQVVSVPSLLPDRAGDVAAATEREPASAILEKAVMACEAEKVDAEATGDPADVAYNAAIDHCIASIRALGAAGENT